MCGNGHYSMKGIIEVVTQAEYDEWLAKQKPAYYAAFPERDPSNMKPAVPVVDSTKKATADAVKVLPVEKKG